MNHDSNHKTVEKSPRISSKDSASMLFKRYVWLVDTIYSAGRITLKELSDKWLSSQLNTLNENFPRRTFYNHRKAIQDMFDIEIQCDRRNGNCLYIENAEDLKLGGVRQWLVNTFAVSNLINESHKLKERIVFEDIPSGQKFLTPVIQAMRDNLSIQITYQSFNHPHSYTFVVDPYCVKIFRQRWYIAAYNEYQKEVRMYALDRIHDLQVLPQKFVVDPNFSPQEYFIHKYGVSGYCDAEIVKIRVSNKSHRNRYIISLPLHHSQEVVEQTADYTVFSYFVSPTYDFRQELLCHGSQIEVLSPLWLRQEIKEIIADQMKIYNINQ